MLSSEIPADIFIGLSVFDLPKGSSNALKTHKNINLYFKRRHLIICKFPETYVVSHDTLLIFVFTKVRKGSPLKQNECFSTIFLKYQDSNVLAHCSTYLDIYDTKPAILPQVCNSYSGVTAKHFMETLSSRQMLMQVESMGSNPCVQKH